MEYEEGKEDVDSSRVGINNTMITLRIIFIIMLPAKADALFCPSFPLVLEELIKAESHIKRHIHY